MDSFMLFKKNYDSFVEDTSRKIDVDLVFSVYAKYKEFRECFEWHNLPQFSVYHSLRKTPIPPIGYLLTQTDTTGYTDDERFCCWLPQELGGNGKQYFGEFAADAIYKAVQGNNRSEYDE